MAKKYVNQSVESDASSVDEALAQASQVSQPRQPKSKILATNDPKTVKGYEVLGKAGFPRDGKPHATENRGEGGG